MIMQMSWQYRRHGDGTEDSKVHCRREDMFQCHEVGGEVDRVVSPET